MTDKAISSSTLSDATFTSNAESTFAQQTSPDGIQTLTMSAQEDSSLPYTSMSPAADETTLQHRSDSVIRPSLFVDDGYTHLSTSQISTEEPPQVHSVTVSDSALLSTILTGQQTPVTPLISTTETHMQSIRTTTSTTVTDDKHPTIPVRPPLSVPEPERDDLSSSLSTPKTVFSEATSKTILPNFTPASAAGENSTIHPTQMITEEQLSSILVTIADLGTTAKTVATKVPLTPKAGNFDPRSTHFVTGNNNHPLTRFPNTDAELDFTTRERLFTADSFSIPSVELTTHRAKETEETIVSKNISSGRAETKLVTTGNTQTTKSTSRNVPLILLSDTMPGLSTTEELGSDQSSTETRTSEFTERNITASNPQASTFTSSDQVTTDEFGMQKSSTETTISLNELAKDNINGSNLPMSEPPLTVLDQATTEEFETDQLLTKIIVPTSEPADRNVTIRSSPKSPYTNQTTTVESGSGQSLTETIVPISEPADGNITLHSPPISPFTAPDQATTEKLESEPPSTERIVSSSELIDGNITISSNPASPFTAPDQATIEELVSEQPSTKIAVPANEPAYENITIPISPALPFTSPNQATTEEAGSEQSSTETMVSLSKPADDNTTGSNFSLSPFTVSDQTTSEEFRSDQSSTKATIPPSKPTDRHITAPSPSIFTALDQAVTENFGSERSTNTTVSPSEPADDKITIPSPQMSAFTASDRTTTEEIELDQPTIETTVSLSELADDNITDSNLPSSPFTALDQAVSEEFRSDHLSTKLPPSDPAGGDITDPSPPISPFTAPVQAVTEEFESEQSSIVLSSESGDDNTTGSNLPLSPITISDQTSEEFRSDHSLTETTVSLSEPIYRNITLPILPVSPFTALDLTTMNQVTTEGSGMGKSPTEIIVPPNELANGKITIPSPQISGSTAPDRTTNEEFESDQTEMIVSPTERADEVISTEGHLWPIIISRSFIERPSESVTSAFVPKRTQYPRKTSDIFSSSLTSVSSERPFPHRLFPVYSNEMVSLQKRLRRKTSDVIIFGVLQSSVGHAGNK